MSDAPRLGESANDNAAEAASGFPMNWGVALCAFVSVAFLLASGMWAVVHDVSRETRDPMDPLRAFAPHLFVFAAAVSGFRITANVAAVLTALGWGFLSGFVTLMSLGTATGALLFTLIQVALLVLAIVDLVTQRNRAWHHASITRMLFGPVLGAIIAIGVAAGVHRAEAADGRAASEYTAKRSRDSIAAIEEHARVLASPAWKATAALDQLHTLTHCIDVYHRSGPAGGGQPFPRSLADLVRWATSDEQRGHGFECYRLLRDANTTSTPPRLDPHHVVRYRPPRHLSDTTHARGYVLELEAVWDSTDEPVARDSPAVKSYLLDAAGRVHVAPARRRATLADRILRLCHPSERNMRDVCWIDAESY